MPARILHELCQHALDTFPEECCGLLVGNSLERYRRLFRCTNVMTALHLKHPDEYPRDGRAAFWMREQDYLDALQEAERAGERVTAVYHSHAGAGLYLSSEDLANAENPRFPFPEADQIVISVYERTVHGVAVFRRLGHGFSGHPIERVDP